MPKIFVNHMNFRGIKNSTFANQRINIHNNAGDMIEVAYFTYNPFYENTYILYNDKKECIIIDPGNYTDNENQNLSSFIMRQDLKPTRLLLTHAHLDHIFGTNYIYNTYGLTPEMHKNEQMIWDGAPLAGQMFGVRMPPLPTVKTSLVEGEDILWHDDRLRILFTPGHSPGSVCLVNDAQRWVIGGDVLFNGSIGRTDLPGGDYDTLITSIRTHLYALPDDYTVYSGHGDPTTIGEEKRSNPFVRG
jgi:glyoxylase-like metal-dependent hydrolase (beta-lactamase superfamily II)